MRFHTRPDAAHRSRRGVFFLGAALLASTLVACNSLLDVPVPNRIPAGSIENPANAVLLTNGAISDFDCALGSFIVVGAELTDEFEDATQTAARWVYDQRSVPADNQRYAVNDCDAEGTYIPINRARESADNVLRILNAATDADVPTGVNRGELIATLYPYAGYARVLLGEMFCSAVISTLNPDGTITYGTELTPQQVFQSADSEFTLGIQAAQAAGDDDALNMAYIGRARARLDMGLYDQAKADAEQVTDPEYVHVATASATTTRRSNRVYGESNSQGVASSVGPRYQDMMFDGVADPRVQAAATGDSTRNGLHEWAQLKYTDPSSPIPIASYDEAQLIIAEADARAGDTGGAIAIIDALHTKAGIPTYTASGGPTDQSSVLNQIVEERSRELWLEGQRLYDVIRFDLTLDPPEGSTYRNGGVYGPSGSALCLKLPDVERQNNPNLQ
ncbi:MAG TPA: RagB/SusD family nutrient uptake outer membrane protein [Gemmatimonadaceae bacterium]